MDLDTTIDWLSIISVVTGVFAVAMFALNKWLIRRRLEKQGTPNDPGKS